MESFGEIKVNRWNSRALEAAKPPCDPLRTCCDLL